MLIAPFGWFLHRATAGADFTFDFSAASIPSGVAYAPPTNGGYWDSSSPSVFVTTGNRFEYDPEAETLRGLLIENAATNKVTNNRDLGTGWTLTNTSKDSSIAGIDNTATPATRLAASSANGTATISATGLTDTAEYTLSAWVKRNIGTGRVDITHDNGTTWTEITGLITGKSNWAQVFVTFTASGTSATIGFRIVTSGDKIDIDCVQVEDGGIATSPILTGGATRQADSLALYTGDNDYWIFVWPGAAALADARYLETVRFYAIGGGDYSAETDWHNPQAEATITHETASLTPATYVPQAADFSAGSVWVESNADVGVLTDGEMTFFIPGITPSSWTTGVNHYLFEINGRVEIYARSADGDTTRKIGVTLRNAAGGIVWSVRTATALAVATPFSVAFSYKDGVRAQLQLSGASSQEGAVDNGGSLDLTRNNMTVGARATGASGHWNGVLGPCWLSDVSYDLTTSQFCNGADPIHFGPRLERAIPGGLPQICMLWDDLVDDAEWGGTFADGSPTLGAW